MPVWPFKQKPPIPKKTQEEMDEALKKNKEASDRLKRTLERLGPMKDASDLLGGM